MSAWKIFELLLVIIVILLIFWTIKDAYNGFKR